MVINAAQDDDSDLRKNHLISQESPGSRWKTETVLRTGRSWNYPGDFQLFPTGKKRNLGGRHREEKEFERKTPGRKGI